VLFLDEPTSGVDPLARRDFWDLIYQLSEKGHTIFVSTHYMDEAEYCHRIALMYRGAVIALNSPAQLKRELGGMTLLRLETEDLMGTLDALKAAKAIEDVSVFGSGLHLRVRDVESAKAEAQRVLTERGIRVLRLEPIDATMEDVFVGLIEAEERK